MHVLRSLLAMQRFWQLCACIATHKDKQRTFFLELRCPSAICGPKQWLAGESSQRRRRRSGQFLAKNVFREHIFGKTFFAIFCFQLIIIENGNEQDQIRAG